MTEVSQCCLEFSFHEGTPKGEHKTIFGLDTYVAGKLGKKVIVCLTDIYGNHFQNMMLLADRLAQLGDYYVLVPDILRGDPVPLGGPFEREVWIPNHTPDITTPIVQNYVDKLKQDLKPEFIGAIGYCFGARYVLQDLQDQGRFDAGCIAHPSVKEFEVFEQISKPLLISAAEVDKSFPSEFRHLVEDVLITNKVLFQSTLFQGTSHGFAVKGDFTDLNVVYAANKSLKDHIDWFNRFSN